MENKAILSIKIHSLIPFFRKYVSELSVKIG